ncbi:tyrosine-type recombinase/integrase [Alienimonas sp. DA493]|uniref:tyrosine-type recombinase/integrase n=1 Tax=Alienimonas sp. DA493 TaxID=3373605 RepID=UPI0037545AB2
MSKPAKPYPEYPLTPRTDGRWQKKVRGRLHYFSGDWKEALAEWERVRPYLLDGLEPPPPVEVGVTLGFVCNKLLNAKLAAVEAGQLAPQTFRQWKDACGRLVGAFGPGADPSSLKPADFTRVKPQIVAGRGVHAVQKDIATIRGVFKWAFENEFLDRPVNFGTEFKPPRKAAMRKARREAGERMVEAHEFRDLLKEAYYRGDVRTRAVLLLGMNCAYGPTDVATLNKSHLDLENGWAEYPRPKTQADRKAALWPETVEALRETIKDRPRPVDPVDDDAVFLSHSGRRLVQAVVTERQTVNTNNRVSSGFRELADAAGIYRPGLSFYGLRRAFRTVADELLDHPTADLVMGHASGEMAAVYRQRLGEDRLRAMAEHVRKWALGVRP